jgi:hypothetical protein
MQPGFNRGKITIKILPLLSISTKKYPFASMDCNNPYCNFLRFHLVNAWEGRDLGEGAGVYWVHPILKGTFKIKWNL